jgi:hypothetical protein
LDKNKVQKISFPYLLFFLITFSAQASTIFVWQGDPNKPTKGYCYEVDEETYGKKLKAKASLEKCKPEKTAFLFVYDSGKCYEVDDKTTGKEYIKKTRLHKCRPNKVTTKLASINGEVDCYEVDVKTEGQHYYKKVKKEDCASDLKTSGVTTYYWSFKNPGYGTCYKEVNLNGESLKVDVEDTQCRPKNFIYRFIRKNETSGMCVEQDPDNERAYSLKTEITNCKPKDTVFVFYTPENKKYGHCYEIDSETKGNLYINKVDNSECTTAQ